MHAASLRSDRLQRVLHALKMAGGRGLSTLEIIQSANVCAVNSLISELRANNQSISCKQEARGRFRYRLVPASTALPVGDR